MNEPARIALIGEMGTGSEFVAAQLANALGAERISFRSEVCKVAEQVLGRKIDKTRYPDRNLFADIRIHWGCNDKTVDSGVEARLSEIWSHTCEKPESWVNALDRAIAEITPDKPLILDDLRFVNEMEFLLDRGFCIFRVHCSLGTLRRRLQRGEDFYILEEDFFPYPCESFPQWVSKSNRLPTLWHDHRPWEPDIRDYETPEMFMTPAEFVTALRNDDRDGMLLPEENALNWRINGHLFENPDETKSEFDAWQESLGLY